MKRKYDFSKGKRNSVIPAKGKTRITIYLDDDVLQEFRDRADPAGRVFQSIINDTLRAYLNKTTDPVDEETLCRVLREELRKTE